MVTINRITIDNPIYIWHNTYMVIETNSLAGDNLNWGLEMNANATQSTFWDIAEAAIAVKLPPGATTAVDTRVALSGRARALFEAMSAIVEAPNSILKHYKKDFYKYDAEYLARTHAIGAHIWIVRDSGTHLARIGVHERMHLDIEAVLQDCRDGREIYLIESERISIKRISEGRARDLMKTFEYKTHNSSVTKDRDCIAWLDVRLTPWTDGRAPQGIVRIEPIARSFSKGDLIALRQIAECEVIAASQSLFTGTKSCTLNGVDVFDLIEQTGQTSFYDSKRTA